MWGRLSKNLSNLLQKIKITFVLLKNARKRIYSNCIKIEKKDKTDLSNPYNRLIELYSLDK